MKKENNLYWSIYKNLEKEVIELSNHIYFSDDQLDVYSIKIAELIIRCSIEIESIVKELYEQNGGDMNPVDENGQKRDLYFDTDCMDYIENKWKLSKKKVFVSATTFYFKEKENLELTPLYKANKRGTSGSKWKQAYQSIKHNRANNISKGNIKNLIGSMAALYLLNIYLKDDKITLKKGEFVSNESEKFDTSRGSDIFSITMKFVAFPGAKPKNKIDCTNTLDYENHVYLKIADDETCKKEWNRIEENTKKIIIEMLPILQKKEKHLNQFNSIWEIVNEHGEKRYVEKAILDTMPRVFDIIPIAVLNKNQIVYSNE
ncbi:MAG: hypothetical protein LBM25_04535 [Bacteroidales bacterium]|jgi:hypothetical protein|nr:hypothetical protein [Bacteroidales bacterium]